MKLLTDQRKSNLENAVPKQKRMSESIMRPGPRPRPKNATTRNKKGNKRKTKKKEKELKKMSE